MLWRETWDSMKIEWFSGADGVADMEIPFVG